MFVKKLPSQISYLRRGILDQWLLQKNILNIKVSKIISFQTQRKRLSNLNPVIRPHKFQKANDLEFKLLQKHLLWLSKPTYFLTVTIFKRKSPKQSWGLLSRKFCSKFSCPYGVAKKRIVWVSIQSFGDFTFYCRYWGIVGSKINCWDEGI